MNNSMKPPFLIYSSAAVLLVVSFFFNLMFLTFIVFIFVGFFAIRNWLSSQAAFAASIMIFIVVVGFVELFSRFIPVLFVNQIQLLLLFIALLLMYFAIKHNPEQNLKIIQKRNFLPFFSIALPSFISLCFVLWGQNISTNLGWMLQGDAQNNTVAVDEIITKNGFPGGLPAISQGLMAYFVAGTLGNEISPIVFIPLIQIQALVLLFLWFISSVVFGIIALREAPKGKQAIGLSFGFFAALLPFSWYLLGFSVEAGFYNTPIALISIATSWIFWRELETHKGKKIWLINFFLFLNVFFALIAWTPLAIVPFGFILFSALRNLKKIKFNSRTMITASLGAGFMVVISIVAFLPSLSFFGKISSAQGYMADYSPLVAAATLVIGFLSAVIVVSQQDLGSRTLGVIILGISIAVGISFLLLAGFVETHDFGWTYYPSKMAWISVFFFAFITSVIFISHWLSQKVSPLLKTACVLSVMILFAVGMLFVPAIGSGPGKYFPFMNIALNGSDETHLIQTIQQSLETKSIRLSFDLNDYLVNQWVFQWKKYEQNPQVWGYAYSIIDNAEDVCSAATTWGGDLTLYTNSPVVINQTKELCGDMIAKVVSE